MHSSTLYWVWLQCALGISAALRSEEISVATGGAKAIFEASDYERRVSGVFTGRQLDKLRRTPFSAAEAIAEECARQKVHILSPQDSAYPALLRQIPNHPLALYVRGDVERLRGHLCISIVGTRRADRKSVDITSRLASDLVRAGCAVVSGGALGIDSAAHWGALHSGGVTAAILGCGISNDYLPENNILRQRIAQGGAVISEFPGNTQPSGHTFPIRNRIIAGMTVGTVVVEAGERSGSLITASCAAEQGRDVFAVPGDAFGSTYTGGNKLIREGAKPVFAAADILSEYELIYPTLLNMRQVQRDLSRPSVDPAMVHVKPPAPAKPAPPPPPKPTPAPAAPVDLPPAMQQILQSLGTRQMHIDDIMKATALPPPELFTALTQLEIQGLVEQEPGKLYTRC